MRGEVPFNGAFGRRYYDYLLVPVIGASGEVEAVAGTTRDVTEHKQLESSLIDADRRKDEFLATLAHELRNPLAPIRNAVQLLKVSSPSEDTVRMAREIIERQINHMVRLVDDLMDVSRITVGQVNLRNERVPSSPRARRCARGRSACDRSRQTPAAGRHSANRARRSKVTQRVCRRCFRTCWTTRPSTHRRAEPSPCVRSRLAIRSRFRCVTTESESRATVHPRVFEMFTRVHPSDRIKTSGLGIGLSLAKKLIELHLGKIEVRSDGPGMGSEFIVTLPALPAAAAPTPKAAPDSDGSRVQPESRQRVLVVDDNRDAAESLGMLLEMDNRRVSVAFDGLQALEAYWTLSNPTSRCSTSACPAWTATNSHAASAPRSGAATWCWWR